MERISDGVGKVYEHTYEELLKYDFGVKFGEKFKGLKILRFEEILKKFACHAVMNIHIKTINNSCEYDKELLGKIIALIDEYDCQMTANINNETLYKEFQEKIKSFYANIKDQDSIRFLGITGVTRLKDVSIFFCRI